MKITIHLQPLQIAAILGAFVLLIFFGYSLREASQTKKRHPKLSLLLMIASSVGVVLIAFAAYTTVRCKTFTPVVSPAAVEIAAEKATKIFADLKLKAAKAAAAAGSAASCKPLPKK
jgi:NADH:ubiquinone oxidoreductase subunit 6 (subunit J)